MQIVRATNPLPSVRNVWVHPTTQLSRAGLLTRPVP